MLCQRVPVPIDAVSLNESPSEKEGKCGGLQGSGVARLTLNESPSEKEGKSAYQ